MDPLIQKYLKHLTIDRGFARNTAEAYRNDLNQLAAYIRSGQDVHGDVIGWRSIDQSFISGYMTFLTEKGNNGAPYSPATVMRKVAAMRSFFIFLHKDGDIPEDITQGLHAPRVARSVPSVLSVTQVAALLAQPWQHDTAQARRDKAMLELLYASGLRVSELVALDVDDLRFDESLVRSQGRGPKERLVPLYREAVRALRVYLETGRPVFDRRGSEQALFINRRGNRLTRQGFWLILKSYAHEAGLGDHVTPHTLRHSFAVHLLRGGAPLRDVQELLGHSSVSTTQVYAQLADDHLRIEVEQSHPRARFSGERDGPRE